MLLVAGVKSYSVKNCGLEEITPLVTSVKSYIYTFPTERKYAITYWRKILQYVHYRLEEITPLVTGIKSYLDQCISDWRVRIYAVSYWRKSYSIYITDWKKIRL